MTRAVTTTLHLWLRDWDIRLDSPNRTRGKHWASRSRRAKAAKVHVMAALAFARWDREPVRSPVAVIVTRYLGPRERALDPDNAVSACKPLLDALVHHGVIAGDTPAHIQDISVRSVRGGGTGVDIDVTTAGPSG